MLVSPNSISRPTDPDPSLDYNRLFQEGLKHIEALSGKIWTDYNAHDPGISILEVLCYAITELGYRCDFEIGDIITPESPAEQIISDFFTLAQVGSNEPLTINDFRKVLIDLEGYRNAWLEKVTEPQPPLFLDTRGAPQFINSDLGVPEGQEHLVKPINIKGLYNVYLQFEEHPDYGDLNDNSLSQIFEIKIIGVDAPIKFQMEVEFPLWSELGDDFDDIQAKIESDLPDGEVKFTIDLVGNDVTIPTGYTEADFVYGATVVVNESSRAIEMTLTLRLLDGQDLILNKNEFLHRVSDQFKNQSLLAGPANDLIPEYGIIPLFVKFLGRRKVIQGYLEDARKTLAQRRNLCEDFEQLYPMSLQEIGIDVSLDVVSGTDVEQVMAEVYHRTQLYLSPTIRFYSLREMLDKGYTAEQIFRGPILANGFIDEQEQAFNLQREKLYTSDLLQEYMKIPGVRVVKRLTLSRYVAGRLVQGNLTECVCIDDPGRSLTRLNVSRSKVSVDAGNGKPETPNLTRAEELLKELKALNQLKGSAEKGDFELPTGEWANLADYFSIQNEFPANYAIGVEGVASGDTDLRKAQAHQLKAFLLFFDQLLVNFHAQLANLRKLYSYSDDADRTYFTQALWQVPRVQELLYNYTNDHPGETLEFYQSDPHAGDDNYYPRRIDALAESPAIYQDRRKRFLDHLLARFNESFTEYAAYVFSRKTDKASQYDRLIQDQALFLRHYTEHSSSRGTGFDYQKKLEGGYVDGSYFTTNAHIVPGLKLRMAYLVGLPHVYREYINPFEKMGIVNDDINPISFTLMHPDDGDRWFYSIKNYATIHQLLADMAQFVDLCADPVNYDLVGNELHLKIGIGSGIEYVAAIDQNHIEDLLELGKSTEPLGAYIASLYGVENLHIVEHILLRQRSSADPLLEPRIVPDCKALDIEDPYSFRISVVLPTWSGRFQELEFRRLFKRLMRMETPAHVYVHFFWIDPVQMYLFEHCFSNWLDGEWLVNNSILLWQDDSKEEKAPLVQQNTFKLLLDRRAAGGEFGIFFQDCMIKLRNLLDCYYEVMPPRIVDQYDTPCELLARPIDPDGEITRAWLPDPSQLPAGTCIDRCSGEIRIKDLVAFATITKFEFPIDVVTINSAGEVTHSSFVIRFIENYPAEVDFLQPAQHEKKYTNGQVLVTFKDADNASDDGDVMNDNLNDFTDSAVERWFRINALGGQEIEALDGPPAGITFLGIPNNKIVVTQANHLVPGAYRAYVWLADNKGGESYVVADWEILPDHPAVPTVLTSPSLNQDAYTEGQLLATISDIDEGIASFVVTDALKPIDLGMVAVINPSKVWELRIGNLPAFFSALSTRFTPPGVDKLYRYRMHVTTTDSCGGVSDSELVLTVRRDFPPVFSAVPPKHINQYVADFALGYVEDVNDLGLVSIHDLADFTAVGISATKVGARFEFKVSNVGLFQSQFPVGTTQVITPHSISVPIETTDGTGGKGDVNCVFTVILDRPAIANMESMKHILELHAGYTLGTITDADKGIATFVPSPDFATMGVSFTKATPTGADPHLRISIANLTSFLAAVANVNIFVPDPENSLIVRYKGYVDTVDLEGGSSHVEVTISVLVDEEPPVTVQYVVNSLTQDYFVGDAQVAILSKAGRTLSVQSIVPGLPPGITWTILTGGRLQLKVSKPKEIEPGTYPLTIRTIDNLMRQNNVAVTVVVLPIILLDITFPVTPTGDKSMHFLDINSEMAGLKITSFEAPFPLASIGTLELGDGKFPIFKEGLGFFNISTGISVKYRGIRDGDNMQFTGQLIINRDFASSSLTITDRFNARPVTAYNAGTVIFSIRYAGGMSIGFTEFLGAMPPGIDAKPSNLYGPVIEFFVKNPDHLVIGHYQLKGDVKDALGALTPINLMISILPHDDDLHYFLFEVEAPKEIGKTELFDVSAQVPLLKIISLQPPMAPPYMPGAFGLMNPAEGQVLGFVSSFNAVNGTDPRAYPIVFSGRIGGPGGPSVKGYITVKIGPPAS